jgi:hypothetical protein
MRSHHPFNSEIAIDIFVQWITTDVGLWVVMKK